MDYSQALEYLKSVQNQGAKLALDNIQNIIRQLPFDLQKISFIQVAGTNGKGSTSNFIASVLKQAGYSVGLFTSPHLQTIRERIAVNGEMIAPEEFAHSLQQVKEISRSLFDTGKIANMPTFFEHIFLTAIFYFYSRNIQYAVLEVGLGGRLDATTTLMPVVSVITNISYDHTKTLGKRIRDIAAEKAGIIKPRIPVVCGCLPGSVSLKVIRNRAESLQSPLHQVTRKKHDIEFSPDNGGYACSYSTGEKNYQFHVSLAGSHQTRNAATAVKTVEILNTLGARISPGHISIGIRSTFIPSRIEIIRGTPPIILDGGHNVAGIKALSSYLKERNYRNLTLIFGVLRDKKYRRMISLLSPFLGRVIVTEPISRRALPAQETARHFNSIPVKVELDYKKALADARTGKATVLIAGSLYMAGEMRNLIFGEKL